MYSNQAEDLRPFIDEHDIKTRISSMVKEIAHDLQNNECIVVGILKKSFVFHADFIRQLHSENIAPSIDFITLSSENPVLSSSDKILMEQDISIDIKNKWILFVDDILDTGHTAAAVTKHLTAKNPKILKTCVLLDKSKKREILFQPDYVGFTIPDVFVVGYGLGYNHRCRELPSLAIAAFEEIDSPLEFSINDNKVLLNGRLDAYGVEYIRETLLHWKGNLHLDLFGLDFISSAGLGLFSMVLKELKKSNHEMILLNVKPTVREMISLAGFEKMFRN